MEQVALKLKTLKPFIEKESISYAKISDVKVGWHIDHFLLVINSIYKVLKESNPATYKADFNLKRSYVFTTNQIPRGKGKAPKQVVPKQEFSVSEINKHFEKVEKILEAFKTLDANAHFKHPYLGCLNKKQSLRFLVIHTNHHLKIIRDIITHHTN